MRHMDNYVFAIILMLIGVGTTILTGTGIVLALSCVASIGLLFTNKNIGAMFI